jgi:hypothetical protein
MKSPKQGQYTHFLFLMAAISVIVTGSFWFLTDGLGSFAENLRFWASYPVDTGASVVLLLAGSLAFRRFLQEASRTRRTKIRPQVPAVSALYALALPAALYLSHVNLAWEFQNGYAGWGITLALSLFAGAFLAVAGYRDYVAYHELQPATRRVMVTTRH